MHFLSFPVVTFLNKFHAQNLGFVSFSIYQTFFLQGKRYGSKLKSGGGAGGGGLQYKKR